MMPAVQVHCPNCSRVYALDRELLGRTGNCGRCGQKFLLSRSESGNEREVTASSELISAGTVLPLLPRRSPTLARLLSLRQPLPGCRRSSGAIGSRGSWARA